MRKEFNQKKILATAVVISAFGLICPNFGYAASTVTGLSKLQTILTSGADTIKVSADLSGLRKPKLMAFVQSQKTPRIRFSNGVMTGAAAHQPIEGDVTGTYSDETSTQRGGALYNTDTSLEFALKNATFTNNKITADYFGGAIYNAGKMTVSETNSFSGNQAQNGYGGAIAQSGGALSIEDGITEFTNNSATASGSVGGYGGAAYINNTNFTIEDAATVTFDGNSSTLGGGALYIYNHKNAAADTEVYIGSGTEFKNNTNTNSSVYGGGAIMVDRHSEQTTYAPHVTINGATFTNNTGGNGGALYNHEGVFNISDATFTGNTTLASGHGGAIYNDSNSVINLNGGNTFSGNTDSTGSNDIYNAGTINLSGTNTFDGGITGTGTVNLTDGLTTINNSLIGNNVNVTAGELIINADNLKTASNIQNADTLTLTGGTLTNKVQGTGHTDIDTTDFVKLSANVMQLVNVKNGQLRTKANNLKSGATNEAGTSIRLEGGELASNISGDGKTILSNNSSGGVTVNSGVTITQETGGVTIISGGTNKTVTNKGTIDAPTTNNANSKFANEGTIYNGVTNNGIVNNNAGGTIYGGLKNYATATNEGTSDKNAYIGTVYNENGATFTNGAYGLVDTKFDNKGGATVINNELGVIHVLNNFANGSVENNVNAIITNLNNKESGDVVNAGLLTNTYNSGTITNTGRFTDIVTNYTTGVITTDASGIDSTATAKNDGNLTLTGGTLGTTINHYTAGGAGGTTVVDGDVLVAYGKAINQDITINGGAGKSLTANVSSIGGNVDNDGLLNIFSQEDPLSAASQMNYAVSGDGKTVMQRNVTVAADIENEIQIATYNDGVNDYFADVTVLSGNKLGTSGKAITIDADNTLTMQSAADLKSDVTNNGELILNSNTLANNVSGSGTTTIDGTVTSDAEISTTTLSILGATTADPSVESQLIIRADKLTVPNNNSIQNAGNLTLTGGSLGRQIHGTGHTDIDTTGQVTFGANVWQHVNVLNGKLKTKANNIKVGATNDATLELSGNTLSADVDGTGKTHITGNVTIDDGVRLSQDSGVFIKSGATQVTNKGIIAGGLTNGSASYTAATVTNSGIISDGTVNYGTIDNITPTVANGGIYGGLTNHGIVTNTGTDGEHSALITLIYNKDDGTVTNNAYGVINYLNNENTTAGAVTNNVNGIITNLTNSGDVVNAGMLTNVYNSGTITNNIGTNNGILTNIVDNYTGGQITTVASGIDSAAVVKNDGTITFTAGNIGVDINSYSTAATGVVEIDAGDGNTVNVLAANSISDNYLQLTSGIFDATNRADSDGNFDYTDASTGLGVGLIANGGTLSVQDDKIGEITLGVVDTDTYSKDLNLMIDAQFTDGARDTDDVFLGTADKIVNSSVNNTANKIMISSIKIIADPVATEFKAQVADDNSKGSVDVSATTLTGLTPGAGSILVSYSDGWIKGVHTDLDNAIISTIPSKMYSMDGDEAITNTSGALTLKGETLSITGNGAKILSTVTTEGGIIIDNANQTLSITNATFGDDTNYFTTAIDNTVGATINLTDMTFGNNTTAIINNGTGEKGVFLFGTNEFNSGITGTGHTTVKTGTTTFNADVTQSLIEVKTDAALINNADMLASNVINDGTFTNSSGASVTATETLTNTNIFNSNGDVAANLVNNTGVYTNYGDGTLTVNTDINNYGTNAKIDNAGSILAQNINNAATIDNANGGTITATATFGSSNTVNNNGEIFANALNNTGVFTNFGDGEVTVNTTILNDTNATFDNAGDVLAQDIVNKGTFANANGGTVTATGTLTNSNTFNTNGDVNANALTNTGALTNYADGVINVNETLANFGDNADIKNLGKINAKDINNAKDITNYGNAEIKATNNFINSGALTNLADGSITVMNKLTNLTTGDIENAGSILAAEIDNSALVNNANGGSITATGKLTNSKTFNSNGDVAANAMDNTGVYTNYGDGTLTVNTTINNYGENADIENAGSILAKNINNAALVNNANGGTITATETLTNSNTFNTNGEVNANAFSNTGALTNYADGVINVNETLANFGDNADIKNLGKINAKDINNAKDITNYGGGEIKATNNFINSGALTNLADGSITVMNKLTNLTTGDIENAGSILAAEIDNSALVNNANGGSITATGKLTNSKTFNSNGDVAANVMDNTGVYTNYGDGTLTVNTDINNYGDDALIDNAGSILAQNINNAATINNVNGGTITATDTFGNSNTVNNNGDILANALNNTGAFTNYADGNVTVNTKLLNDTNGTFDNAGDVLAQDVENNGVVNNANGGNFTATNDLDNNNEFNNDGVVASNTLENSGTFTNYENGDVNVNTTLTNETGGEFDNAGDVIALDIVNDGVVNNANGGNITATNNLNNTNEFNSDGNVNAASLDNSGVFTNYSNGIVNVNTTFDNTNTVNNDGVVNTQTFANEAGALLTNDGVVNAFENFNNDGVVDNTDEGLGTLNIKNGYSNDSITQGIINISADNTAFDNNALMIVETLLNNDGTLNNTSDIIVANSTNDATLDNSGVINTTEGSSIIANRLINDDATINMTQALVRVTDQDQNINGTINTLGADAANDVSTLSIAGVEPTFAGTLNVGNLADKAVKSTLQFQSGAIADVAEVNIAKGNVLNIADSSPDGDSAYVTLNENDTFKGDVVLDNGNLEMSNVSYTTGDTSTTAGGTKPYYEQNGGNLVLYNATLTMQDASKIGGGNMLVDKDSVFNSQSNGFNVDNLANGGMVNAINGGYENYGINKALYAGDGISSKGNFTVDLYARSNDNKKYDSFGGDSTKIYAAKGKEGTLHVADFALNGDLFGEDAPIDESIMFSGLFGGKVAKGHNIHFTSTDKEILTPIAWYQLNNKGGGNYALEISRFNPDVFRGQVTKVAQYQNQLAIDDMIFNHTMLDQGFKGNDRLATMANKYASANDMYAPYQYSRKEGGLWVKTYANFERLNMNHGLDVGNNAYGSIIGADFGLKDLRRGWKFMPTAYVGYNGAHQYWNGMGAYQNGGQLGVMGTWYKDNFMIGALAFAGLYGNDMTTPRGHDDTLNYFAGGATKAAYNWRVHKDWSIQPNLLVAYSYFGQENWHTDFGQMGMMSGMLHGVNIAPGLNLIWEKETFSAYVTVQYMYNVNQSTGGRAGNVDLPNVHMDRGYLQYGIGVNKQFTDTFSGYFQTVIRNVGRTGVGLQLGLNWKLGGSPKSKKMTGGASNIPQRTVIKSLKR